MLYLQLVDLQRYNYPEAQIASKLNRTSLRELFEELKGYGFPICEICGANPVVGRHCLKEKPKARRVEGDPEKLPAIENAATRFRDTIRTLGDHLEQALSLKEVLQGRYFLGEGETEGINIREVRGAQWHPHPHVVVLIATSILEHRDDWGFVEYLLKQLHPRPSEANRQQLVRFIYGRKVDNRGRAILDRNDRPQNSGDGLLDRANQIAALVRGKVEIGRGRKGPNILSYEQHAILHIKSLVDKGFSRDQIARREREEFERLKEYHLQSLREELELEQANLSQDALQELEDEIRRTEAEEHDEDLFNRLYDLSKDLG